MAPAHALLPLGQSSRRVYFPNPLFAAILPFEMVATVETPSTSTSPCSRRVFSSPAYFLRRHAFNLLEKVFRPSGPGSANNEGTSWFRFSENSSFLPRFAHLLILGNVKELWGLLRAHAFLE